MSDAPSSVSEVTARWGALPGGVLDGGEIIILAIKPSMWRPAFESAAWIVASGVLAGALVSAGRPIPGLSVTTTAQLILLVGLARLALAIVRWTTTWHLLTNRRIIDVHGVRSPVVRDCLLVRIRNTYLRSSVAEKATGLGSIIFVSDEPTHVPHAWQSLAKPDEIHAKVRRAIENALDQTSV